MKIESTQIQMHAHAHTLTLSHLSSHSNTHIECTQLYTKSHTITHTITRAVAYSLFQCLKAHIHTQATEPYRTLDRTWHREGTKGATRIDKTDRHTDR